MKVPSEIKHYASNAQHYLDAAGMFPEPINPAVEILLLITGWENIIIADKKLSEMASGLKIDTKVLKDHETKLNEIDENSRISRVIVGPPGKGIPAVTTDFKTGAELKRLRQICMFGDPTESHDLKYVFRKYWHTDNFSRGLRNKIKWTEMLIKIYEELA